MKLKINPASLLNTRYRNRRPVPILSGGTQRKMHAEVKEEFSVSSVPACRTGRPSSALSAVSAFRLLAFVSILNTQYSIPAHAQTWMTNTGAKIYVGAKGAVNVEGNIQHDSTSILHNYGTVKSQSTVSYGTIELEGDSSFLAIDSTLLLEKGSLTLKSNSLILYSGDTLALQIDSANIVAETYLAKNSIKWYVGNKTGLFKFPFRTDSLKDVSVKLDVLTAGTPSSNGSVSVTTYPTAIDNYPYPVEGMKLTDSLFQDISQGMVNRFWKVTLEGYSQKPYYDLKLKYDNFDLLYDYLGTLIDETKLKAQLWTGTKWEALTGTVDTATNTITIDSISKSGIWVIVDSTKPLYLSTLITEKVIDQIPGQLNTGSITLILSGGQPPYTVHWYDDDTALIKTNLSAGIYPVDVIDDLGDTVSKDIKVNYQFIWTDTAGVQVSGNSIKKTSESEEFDAGGSSRNALMANQDGYLEFTGTTEGYEQFYMGLSETNPDATAMEYSLKVRNSYIYIYESGNQIENIGQHRGNVFRIAREADSISYYRNGNVVRRIATDRTRNLSAHLGLGKFQPKVDSLRLSFDIPFRLRYSYTDVIPGVDSSGAITLTVIGGTAPYTYSWSDGANTPNRDSLNAGTYNVTVIDDDNDTLTAIIELMYQIVWKDTIGVTVTGNSITKINTASGFDAGGSSKNYLKPGEDGFVEFTVKNALNRQFYFGMSEQDLDETPNTIEFAFLRSDDDFYIIESGRLREVNEYVETGNRFIIARQEDSLKYYRNGVLLRSVWTDTTERLLLDVSLGANNPSIYNVRASFGVPFGVDAKVTDASTTHPNTGKIELTVLGGHPPFSYQWSNEDTTVSIDSLTAGVYAVTVTDSEEDSITGEIEVGRNILWQNIQNVTTTVNSIEKATNTSEWDAGASSLNFIPISESGYVEFLFANEEDERFFIGLSENDQDILPGSIDYSIEVNNGTLHVKENGSDKGSFGEVLVGDVIRIERVNDTLIYSKNGMELKKTGGAQNKILIIDASLKDENAGIRYIKTNIGGITNYRARYWVASEDSFWNNPDNWSIYSGGPGGAGVPDSLSTVLFDGNGDSNCYLDTSANINGLLIDSGYANSIYFDTFDLNLNWSLFIWNGEINIQQGRLFITKNAQLIGGTVNSGSGEMTVNGYLLNSGATFNGDSSQLSVGTKLELMEGTFISTSQTINLYGAFIDTVNLFSHNNGNVIFRSSSELAASEPFYNMQITESERALLTTDLAIENTLVLDSNATLRLNGHSLEIHNSDTSALAAVHARLELGSSQSFSNSVKWFIGTNTGTYKIPFYDNDRNDLSIEITVTSAGDSANGYLEFSTYGTDAASFPINNRPYPNELSSYYETLSQDASQYVLDRYWLINAHNYSLAPVINATIKYLDTETKGSNMLQEANLYLTVWNEGWDTLLVEINDTLNYFNTDSLSNYGIWLLADTNDNSYNAGSDCQHAILMNGQYDTTWYTMYDTIMWLSFEASDNVFPVAPFSIFQEGEIHIKSITLYEGTCDSLIALKTIFPDSSYILDSMGFSLPSECIYDSLVPETNYFIKIIQQVDNKTRLRYNLPQRNFAPCPTDYGCNLTYYGNFEGMISYYNDVTSFSQFRSPFTSSNSENSCDWFVTITPPGQTVLNFSPTFDPILQGQPSPGDNAFCSPHGMGKSWPEPEPNEGGRSFLGMGCYNIYSIYSEGVSIQFCQSMNPGSKYEISFLATSWCDFYVNVYLGIDPPCGVTSPWSCNNADLLTTVLVNGTSTLNPTTWNRYYVNNSGYSTFPITPYLATKSYNYIYIIVNGTLSVDNTYGFIDDIRVEEMDLVNLDIETTVSSLTPCISSIDNTITYEIKIEDDGNPSTNITQTSDIVLELDFSGMNITVDAVNSDFSLVSGKWTYTIPLSYGLSENNSKILVLNYDVPNDGSLVGNCYDVILNVTSTGYCVNTHQLESSIVELCAGVSDALTITKTPVDDFNGCFYGAGPFEFEIVVKNETNYTIDNIIINEQYPINEIDGWIFSNSYIPFVVLGGGGQSDPFTLGPGDWETFIFNAGTIDPAPYYLNTENCVYISHADGACELPPIACAEVTIGPENIPDHIEHDYFCDGNNFVVNFYGPGCFTDWVWEVGDPIITVQSQDALNITYALPGTYPVKLTLDGGNYIINDNITLSRPTATLNGTRDGCSYGVSEPYFLTSILPASGNNQYTWSVTSPQNNHSVQGPLSGTTIIGVTWGDGLGGTVSVTIEDENECSITLELEVQPCCEPLEITGPTTNCSPCGTYSISNPILGANYSWSVVGSGSQLIISDHSRKICWNSTGGVTVTSDLSCPDNTGFIDIKPCCFVRGVNLIPDNYSVSELLQAQGTGDLPGLTGGSGLYSLVSTTSFNRIYINGTFKIDENLKIQDLEIFLGRDAQILIENDKSLFIRSSILQAGCNEMWDWIELEANATLFVNNFGSGGKRSLIRDAENAILSKDADKATFWIYKSDLQNNYKHIVIENFQGTVGSNEVYSGSIDHAVFSCPTPLIPPRNSPVQYTKYCIELKDVANINIGHYTGQSNSSENVFVIADRGISIERSSARIAGNVFGYPFFLFGSIPEGIIAANGRNTNTLSKSDLLNIRSNFFVGPKSSISITKYPDIRVTANLILNHPSDGIGVNVTESSAVTNTKVDIIDNWIYSGNMGIKLFNTRNPLNINKNYIFFFPNLSIVPNSTASARVGIYSSNLLSNTSNHFRFYKQNHIEDPHLGIFNYNSSYTYIEKNTIEGLRDFGWIPSTGIAVQNCGTNYVWYNTVTGTDRDDSGQQFGISNITSYNRNHFQCNYLNTLGRGIWQNTGNYNFVKFIQNEMTNVEIGIAIEEGFITNQGSSVTTYDNCWLGAPPSSSPGGHIVEISCPDCNNTTFYLRGTRSSLNCWNPHPFYNSPVQFSVAVSENQPVNPSSPFPPCSGTGGTKTEEFKIENVPQAKLIALDSISFEQDSVTHRWWARHNLYSMLLEEDSLIEADSVLHSFISDYRMSATVRLDSLKREIDHFLTGNFDNSIYTQLRSNVSAISTVHDIDSITRQFLINVLDFSKWPSTSETPQIIDNIEEIATKCFFFGGPSVFEARAVLTKDSLELIGYDWEGSCGGGGEKRAIEIKPEEKSSIQEIPYYYKLYPNLFAEEKSAVILIPDDEEGIIEFFNPMGVKMTNYLVIGGNNSLNLNGISSKGLLFYRVKIGNEVKSQGKIIFVN